MVAIPESHLDILKGKNFAHVATLMRNGAPQVTPIWVDFDGTYVVLNTAEGRQKVRNLDRDGRIAISVHDQENPYRYIQIRGKVVGRSADPGEAHINGMAKKYMGLDKYPYSDPNSTRVIYKVEPLHVQVTG